MKKIFTLLIMLTLTLLSLNAQHKSYELVSPKSTHFLLGIGYMWNTKSTDYFFNSDYLSYSASIGKWLTKSIGTTMEFEYQVSPHNRYKYKNKYSLYTIGIDINARLNDYYNYSLIDFVFNAGVAYSKYKFEGTYINSHIDYIVPTLSLDIAFNLIDDKSLQLVVEPYYKCFIPTNFKNNEPYGNADAKFSGVGVNGKIKYNF